MEWLVVQGCCTAFNIRFLDEINIAYYYNIYVCRVEQLTCSPAKKNRLPDAFGKQHYPIE